MRHVILFLFSFFILTSSHAPAAAKSFVVGETLPNLSFTGIDGQQFALDDLNKPLILMHYWASWCGPCIIEFPKVIKMMQEMNDDITIIAISLDTDASAMYRYIDDIGADGLDIRWVHDHDFKLSYLDYQIGGIPATVFLSPQRRIIKKVNDEFDWTSSAAWKELTTMIAKATPVNTTQ